MYTAEASLENDPIMLKRSSELDYSRYLMDVTARLLFAICRADDSSRLAVFRHRVEDLVTKLRISYSTLLTGLLYMLSYRNKMSCMGSLPTPTMEAAFGLFVITLVLASKYLIDKMTSNICWCTILECDPVSFARGESNFLRIIDYRLHVDHASFIRWMATVFNQRSLHAYTLNFTTTHKEGRDPRSLKRQRTNKLN